MVAVGVFFTGMTLQGMNSIAASNMKDSQFCSTSKTYRFQQALLKSSTRLLNTLTLCVFAIKTRARNVGTAPGRADGIHFAFVFLH